MIEKNRAPRFLARSEMLLDFLAATTLPGEEKEKKKKKRGDEEKRKEGGKERANPADRSVRRRTRSRSVN